MDGFSEKLHNQVKASLIQNSDGPKSLMMVHMEQLQAKKAAEAAAEVAYLEDCQQLEEEERERQKGRKKKSKKKDKKSRKKKDKKRKRRHQDSSSETASSESDDAGVSGGRCKDPLVRAAMDLEKQKVHELRRKEEEKRAKSDAKRRRRESEAMKAADAADAASERARLEEWQDAELHRRRIAVSDKMLTSPEYVDVEGAAEAIGALSLPGAFVPLPTSSSPTGPPKPERVPLHYFTQNTAVAWETPGAGGVGIRFAPLIGVTPGAAAGSEDEW
jgi:hypothetical protein